MFHRILSLAPSNTEILFALDAQDTLVGVTKLCDFPPQTRALPKFGSWIHQQEVSAFSKVKPDLILTSMFVPPTVKAWAEQNAVPLVNLYPQTLGGIYDSILEIGELIDKEDAADRLVVDLRARFQQIQRSASQRRPRVYTEEYHLPPTVAANWVPELITIAGGIPMERPGILSHEVSAAQVAKFDPDLIVLHWCGFGEKQDLSLVGKRPGWGNIRAVRENRIIGIHDTFLNRPGPRIWKGAQLLQQFIHKL